MARHAWANYFKTALSVYSSLNMHYIDPEQLGVDMSRPAEFTEIHGAIRDHLAVPVALKSMGYDYIHLGSWWEPTATNIGRRCLAALPGIGRVLQRAVVDHGALADLAAILRRHRAGWRERCRTGPWRATRPCSPSTGLEESAARSGPDFVFTHVLVPHPPYVFNKDGCFPTGEEVDARSERDNYMRQLQWVNQRVLQAIDRLIDHEPGEPDPIIVLQADEGPWPAASPPTSRASSGWMPQREEMQQKFGILNAVRLPGVDPASVGFNDDTSPVNEFRVVFDAYFDADLPLLPDETYLSPDYARMWDFVRYPHPDR